MNELANVLREVAGDREAKKQPRMAEVIRGAADEIERLSTEHGVMIDALERISKIPLHHVGWRDIASKALSAVSGRQNSDE